MTVCNQNSIFSEMRNKGLFDMNRLYSADTNTLQEVVVVRIRTKQTAYLLIADTSLFLLLLVYSLQDLNDFLCFQTIDCIRKSLL